MEGVSQLVSKMNFAIEEGVEFSDAHCHLDLFSDPERVASEARKGNVGIIITAGSNAESNLMNFRLAKGGVYGVVGLSPDFASSDSAQIEHLAGFLKTNRNIIGIGEIGLDATIISEVEMDAQIRAFEAQLDLAVDLHVPVVVHARKMIGEVIRILKEKSIENAVFHYFEGGEEEARTVEREGWLVSVPPVDSSRRRRALREIGIESIVAETDSPAVGKTPLDVIKVVSDIAVLKGVSTEEAGAETTKTIKEYFYI